MSSTHGGGGSYRGAGIEVVWRQLCALIAIGTVAFVGALARFRKSVSLA